uniref:Protein RFT1 homolog n=1 Tax=Timema shepardi TaxID=629360 RepID=A0A7R9API0_TIMSH|nr:unnamed protein product [Timema shepardi]
MHRILFRCVTFVLNAFVLRHVSQDVVGVMNVRLLLLESTILYLSREAFRRACLSKTTDHNWAQVFSLVFGYIWLYVLTPPSEDITQHYTLGVWSICISCIVEMCCEPVYLVSQAFLFVRLKVRPCPANPSIFLMFTVGLVIKRVLDTPPLEPALHEVGQRETSPEVVLDTIQIVVRTFIFTPLIVYQPQSAVLAFSAAQVISACVYVIGYYVYFYVYIKRRNEKIALRKKDDDVPRTGKEEMEDDFPFESLTDFLPARIENQSPHVLKCSQPPVNYRLANLTWSFFKQGVLKQVLTEGERYIMTLFSVLTFYEQGMYDVVNNLGSLAARFLFRPIEDAAYFYFSQMVRRDSPIQEQNQKHMSESSNVLCQLLRCIASLGLVILVFGQSYSTLLLFLYGGRGLISGPGPTLMRAHCLSVLLLAVNGVTECYSFATMSTRQLDRYNYMMALLSILFLIVSWGLTTLLGGVGFILANCCNMAARIAHSVQFIQEKYHDTTYQPLKGLVPGSYFLGMLVFTGTLTKISEMNLFDSHKLLHLCIGAVSFALVLLAWGYEERELVRLGVNRLRWRRSSGAKQS